MQGRPSRKRTFLELARDDEGSRLKRLRRRDAFPWWGESEQGQGKDKAKARNKLGRAVGSGSGQRQRQNNGQMRVDEGTRQLRPLWLWGWWIEVSRTVRAGMGIWMDAPRTLFFLP